MKYFKITIDDRDLYRKERAKVIKERVRQMWSPSGYLN